MTNNISDPGPSVGDADISAFEAKVGAKLPDDYRRFMLTYNGGVPERRDFDVPTRKGNEEESVDAFHSINDPDTNTNIESALNRLRGRIPDETIPIGYCGCGDTILLTLEGGARGSILLFDHDDEGHPENINLHTLAQSFDEFVDMLY